MKPTQNPTTAPAPDPALNPAAILRGAALYLRRYGWIQDGVFDYGTEQLLPPACAIGAINVCAHGAPLLVSDFFDDDEYTDAAITAKRVFAAFLDSDYASGVKDVSAIDIIAGYNDHKLTTRDEVIDFLTEAAADWEKAHPSGGAR